MFLKTDLGQEVFTEQAFLLVFQSVAAKGGDGRAQHSGDKTRSSRNCLPRDLLLKVFVGGGHNPHICVQRDIPSEPGKLSFLEHPQDFALHGHRHLADLIEKESAAVALFEAPDSLGYRPGKASLFVGRKVRFPAASSGIAAQLMATKNLSLRRL